MKRCILMVFLTAVLLCACGKEETPETTLPVQTTQPTETLEAQPLGVVPEDLLGRWKTVFMTRYGEMLDENDLEEQGFWENLIVFSQPIQGGEPILMANYRQVYPADLGDNTYRLTIQDIPLSQWREELAGISTENQTWSAELEDVYGGNYFSYYLTLEDLDHLTLVLVRNFPEENVEQDHEIIKMVRMEDDEEGIEFHSVEEETEPDEAAVLSKFDISGNWELVSGVVDGYQWEASDEGRWATISIYFEGNNPIVKYTNNGMQYPTMIPEYVEKVPGNWYFQAPEDWGGGGELSFYLVDCNTLEVQTFFYYDETTPVVTSQYFCREDAVT